MAQIPYMNWMGDQPTGSAYDVYQYYLGGGGPDSTQGGGGGGISSLPWYQQTGGGDGGGFNLPQNYYKAPQEPVDGKSAALQKAAGMMPDEPLPRNKVKNYLQNLNFPGKQLFAGAGNLLKTGLGSMASLAGGFLPEMNPVHGKNLRWAVDGAGYGTGTQRDQFGMLTGQSLMDPNRTYEDRLADREDELNEIIKKQRTKGTYKKSGWHQRQLEHIKQVNKIKGKERKEAQRSQKAADAARVARAYREETGGQAGSYAPGGGSGAHAADRSGSTYSDPFDPGGGEKEGGLIRKAQGGMITDLTQDPEYRGWKKMYETNPEIGSMHEKHPTFIKFYKKHERDKKKFGGLAGLLYG
jgi:hypothetical protein